MAGKRREKRGEIVDHPVNYSGRAGRPRGRPGEPAAPASRTAPRQMRQSTSDTVTLWSGPMSDTCSFTPMTAA